MSMNNSFKSSKIKKIWNAPAPTTTEESTKKAKKKKDDDFDQLLREVEKLGGAELKGKQKRQWELKQLVQMGAKLPKNPKVPFPMLLEMRKAQKKKDERLKKQGKDGFLLHQAMAKRTVRDHTTVTHKRLTKTKKEVAEGRAHFLRPSTGKFQNGMLVLSKTELRSVKSERRPKRSLPSSGHQNKNHSQQGKRQRKR